MDSINHDIPLSELAYKSFSVIVTAPDTVYSVSYELDKTVAFVTGISLDSNREKLLYLRGTQKIEINRQEVVPEGFLSRKIYTMSNVDPHRRFLRRGGKIPVGNGIVKIDYRDTSDALAPFEPYVVIVTLDCILKNS